MGLNKIVLGVLILSVGLFASLESYSQGLKYYEEGKYAKAFPIVLKESKKGTNKAAQYRLAEMYEKGLGTKVNYKESTFWYKSAASKYAYATTKKAIASKKEDTTEPDFADKLNTQIATDDKQKAGNEFALSKIDTNTPETKALAASIFDGDFFGLTPYRVNYILPISYSKDKPRRVSPNLGYNGLPDEHNTYNKNAEVAFQLSLKKDLSYDLFGWNEFITAAYTQKVWWQLYDESGPFRETNYQPEIFMTIPTSKSIDDTTGLKVVKLGFIHESNGQEGYQSRSWNRLYADGIWQWDNLFLSTRVWYRIKEDAKPDWYYEQTETNPLIIQEYSDGDDNPDIEDYLGYGDIKLNYLYGKNNFGLMLRNNLDFDDNKGAVEFTYSYPFFASPDSSWYVKIFNGYGESLIDYNVNVTKASFGFSFSNGLF
ncbi:phospholipase A [Sulfurovum sp.]|uniref:phospholipase A n=1 Tax=Sulfurovum sp. TaxID=1969726 RepID=UPI002867DAD3|nr:phospholipase A [Sulfurovum sp.]